MSTRVYAAKAALFARLDAQTGVGLPLEGVDVAYAWRGDLRLRSVYGGGVRFSHTDAVAESLVLMDETALISLYVKVIARPPVPVQETDAEAAALGAEIAALLAADPNLGPGLVWRGMPQGQGDYQLTDDETTSILAYQARVDATLTYTGVG